MKSAVDKAISAFAKTIGTPKPRIWASSRRRPATKLAKPSDGTPAAELSQIAGARKLPGTNIGEPLHRRPAKVCAKPKTSAPAAELSETVEASDEMKPSEYAPLRKRAAKRLAKTTMSPPPAPLSDGHSLCATHEGHTVGEGGGGHPEFETQSRNASDPLTQILFNWRIRQRWHRAEKSLVLQSKALLRSLCDGDKDAANAMYEKAYAPFAKKRRPDGYDPAEAMIDAIGADVGFSLMPLLASVNQIEVRREALEKRLISYTKQLPVWAWVEPIPGFGALTLASLVGEAGDIGSYKSVSALWKRMGVAIIGGRRQRKVTNAEEALENGYSPPRRAVAYLLGQWLIMAGDKNPWRALYEARKAYETPRCEAIAADPELVKLYSRSGKYAPKAHINNRAARYMVKRVLRELYSAWRAIARGEPARAPGQKQSEIQCIPAGDAQIESGEILDH